MSNHIGNKGENPFARQTEREEELFKTPPPSSPFSIKDKISQYWEKITQTIIQIFHSKPQSSNRKERLAQTRELNPHYQHIPSAMKLARLLGDEVLTSTHLFPQTTKRQVMLEKANKIDLTNEADLIPLVMDIGRLFGADKIKETPLETISELVKDASEEDIQRDCHFFSCTPEQIKVKYAERLIKAQELKMTPSQVTQIENIWRLKMSDASQKAEEFQMGDHTVVFIPAQNKETPADLVVYKYKLREGAFKAAHLAFSFFHAHKNLVLLAPLKEDKANTETLLKEKEPTAHTVHIGTIEGGTMVMGTTDFKENISNEGNEELAHLKAAWEIHANKMDVPIAEEEEEDEATAFRREAAICQELSALPGIWKTHKVTEISGKVMILSEAAGYDATLNDGTTERIIELNDLMECYQGGRLPQSEKTKYFEMIGDALKGFATVHEKGYVHFDIKPANILCSKEGRAGVSDFGTACKMEEIKTRFKPIGTPTYVAPEVSDLIGHPGNKEKITEKADVWSVGITLWELLSGESSQDHPSVAHMKVNSFLEIGKLARPGSDARKNYEENYPEPLEQNSIAHLIWQCTRPDPQDRPPMKEILQMYKGWLKTQVNTN